MNPCLNCGRLRTRSALRTRCVCIPESFWHRPDVITAGERLDIVTVVSDLRFRPPGKHLSLMELTRLTGCAQSTISQWTSGKIANPDVRRVPDMFEGLGVPGQRWGNSWKLPEEITHKAHPDIEESKTDWQCIPSMVITAPVPLQVWVMDRPSTPNEPMVVASADGPGLTLVVRADATWTVDGNRAGNTVRIALEDQTPSSPVYPLRAEKNLTDDQKGS